MVDTLDRFTFSDGMPVLCSNQNDATDDDDNDEVQDDYDSSSVTSYLSSIASNAKQFAVDWNNNSITSTLCDDVTVSKANKKKKKKKMLQAKSPYLPSIVDEYLHEEESRDDDDGDDDGVTDILTKAKKRRFPPWLDCCHPRNELDGCYSKLLSWLDCCHPRNDRDGCWPAFTNFCKNEQLARIEALHHQANEEVMASSIVHSPSANSGEEPVTVHPIPQTITTAIMASSCKNIALGLRIADAITNDPTPTPSSSKNKYSPAATSTATSHQNKYSPAAMALRSAAAANDDIGSNSNNGNNTMKDNLIFSIDNPSVTSALTPASVSASALPSCTLEKQDIISKTVQYMMHKREANTSGPQPQQEEDPPPGATDQDASSPSPAANLRTGKGASAVSSDVSFLYELAAAAADIALERKRTKIKVGGPSLDDGSVNSGVDHDDDDIDISFFDIENPEASIQRLLQAAKQGEALLECHKQHLDRVRVLLNDFPTLLEPLKPCWKAMEVSLKANPINNTRVPKVMNILLGRKGDRGTLQFLWGLLDDDDSTSQHDMKEEDRVYKLIRLCFHCAVAHSFLSFPGDNSDDDSVVQQFHIKQGIQHILSSAETRGSDQAIQNLLESFRYYGKQPGGSKTDDFVGDPVQRMVAQQERFLKWHNHHVPNLLSSLTLCMAELVLPTLVKTEKMSVTNTITTNDADTRGDIKTREHDWLLPILERDQGSENILFAPSTEGGLSSWLYSVACTVVPQNYHKKIGSKWPRLYSTHSEGFHLPTLEHCLIGYRGPTLILVEAFDKQNKQTRVFGAFASHAWSKQSSPTFFGDSDSYLIELHPHFRVYRAKDQQQACPSNYQYFYFDKQPITPTLMDKESPRYESGMGLGGTPQQPRFFVSACLDQCYLGPQDATFEGEGDFRSEMRHSLAPRPKLWDLMSLEVWGLGGESALQALISHQKMLASNAQLAQRVDKAAFLGDLRSGLIDSKMFAHVEALNRHENDDDNDKWEIGISI